MITINDPKNPDYVDVDEWMIRTQDEIIHGLRDALNRAHALGLSFTVTDVSIGSPRMGGTEPKIDVFRRRIAR